MHYAGRRSLCGIRERGLTKLKRSLSHKNLTYHAGIGLLLVSLLVLAACSGSGTSTGSSSNRSSPTATAAAPTPTIALQQITVAYCSQILPLATANQIIPSSTPATTITQGNPNNALSGACNYNVSSSQLLLVIFFIPYSGPDPIPQSDIQSILSQAAGTKLTITTLNMVSGIGDQAAYVEVTGSRMESRPPYISSMFSRARSSSIASQKAIFPQ